MLTAITVIFGGILGGCVGSFLGCALYRLPRGIDMNGRSECPRCGQPVGWKNIPVLAYLLGRGHALCCGAPLRRSYLVSEVAAVAVGASVAVALGIPAVFVIAVLTLVVVAITNAVMQRGAAAER